MMGILELKTTSLYDLMMLLDKASEEANQKLVNVYAYEIATRLYVPNDKITFTDMVKEFGYKQLEEQKTLTKKPTLS